MNADLTLGLKGGDYIIDTVARTGLNCMAFYVWEEAVLTSITQSASTPGTVANLSDDMPGRTLPAGSWFHGQFSGIELASGVVQLFNLGT